MTKFEKDDFIPKRKEMFSFVKELGIDLDPHLPILNIYHQLKKDFPVLNGREELQQHTKQIIQAKSLLLNNIHLVISKIITNSLQKVSYSNFPNLQQLSSQLGFTLPNQFHGINIPNSVLDFQSLGKNAKLLIIQNVPDDIRSEFEKINLEGLGIIFIDIVTSTDNSPNMLKQISKNILNFCNEIEVKSNRLFVSHTLPTLHFELLGINETPNLAKSIISWGTSATLENSPKTIPTTHDFKKDGGQEGAGQIQQILQASADFYAYSNSKVFLKLKGSEEQCSDIRFHIIVDEVELGVTDWLGYTGREEELPLETEIISIENLKSGDHTLTLQPEGRDGGCNKGYIQQWEGTLKLYD